MSVELTSPVEGKQAGETYSGPLEDFYVTNGYAKRDGESDLHLATSVNADSDPTLAANREAPDADKVKHGSSRAKAVDGKNAPEVKLGEPLHVEGDEPGAVPPTVRPSDLEERAKRAEADVKGGVVETAPEVSDEEPAPAEGESDESDADVEESAGDGQEDPAKEESTQDGDAAGA